MGQSSKAMPQQSGTKDRAGFEKWLSEIEEEVAKLLKECGNHRQSEDETCKIHPDQEALKKKLSNRNYLKRQIEEALKRS